MGDIPNANSNWSRRPAKSFHILNRLASQMVAFGLLAAALIVASAITYSTQTISNGNPIIVELMAPDVIPKQPEPPKIDAPRGEIPPDPLHPPPPTNSMEAAPDTKITTNPNPSSNPSDNPSNLAPVIGVKGAGGNSGGGTMYGNRPGGQGTGVRPGIPGGTDETEQAVQAGLAWLARHQNKDGSWSRNNFDKNCRSDSDRCAETKIGDLLVDPAVTGLALLAMAGHGNTQLNGPYKDNVARGLKWLISIQAESGLFGDYPRDKNAYMMYNQGIAAFAITEIYAMTKDETLEAPVRKATAFILRAQQPNIGSWDYTDAKTGRYDTSITGWQIMALKSAQAAGIEVPSPVIFRIAAFITGVTQQNGEVVYSAVAPAAGRRGQGMVAVGMTSCQLLGLPIKSSTTTRQMNILMQNLPEWSRLGQEDTDTYTLYYWYYATMAMAQYGGKEWDTWNTALKKELLGHQRLGGCMAGSWDPPPDIHDRRGGRIVCTAMNILNLEVYYRYLPISQSGATLNALDAIITTTMGDSPTDAVAAVQLLKKFDDPQARQRLLTLAQGEDDGLALEACVTLAEQKDPEAIGPLRKHLKSDNKFVRYRVVRAMSPLIGHGLVPTFIDCLSDPDATVAQTADQMLQQYAAQSMGFNPTAPEAERAAAIQKWRDWWKETQQNALVWQVLDAKEGIVSFSTGQAGQTAPGRRCNVYRGGAFLARLDVVKVSGAIAIGRIIPQFSKGEVQAGDTVRPEKSPVAAEKP